MAHLRYVRDPSKLQAPMAKANSSVSAVRMVYETEPEIAEALLPKPLVPAERPEVFVQHASVDVHVSETETRSISAVTVAVRCSYEGIQGAYVIAMPMDGEFVVITGREVYGEPKKIAENTSVTVEGNKVRTVVGRHGIDFLETRGEIGPSKGPAKYPEYFFCHKALPNIDRSPGFDGDVFLTQLIWERNYTDVKEILNPEIILRDSAYDPLIDVPVVRIVSAEFAEGSTLTSGKILTKIPGEWIVNHFGQRYDDADDLGVDISLASEKEVVNA
jgi:acetoacetate decarboxylase